MEDYLVKRNIKIKVPFCDLLRTKTLACLQFNAHIIMSI